MKHYRTINIFDEEGRIVHVCGTNGNNMLADGLVKKLLRQNPTWSYGIVFENKHNKSHKVNRC